MRNHDWIKRMRDQLSDYQEPIDESLWSDIERSLSVCEKPKASVFLFRKWISIAAIVLFVVTGVFWYLNKDSVSMINADKGRCLTNRIARDMSTMKNMEKIAHTRLKNLAEVPTQMKDVKGLMEQCPVKEESDGVLLQYSKKEEISNLNIVEDTIKHSSRRDSIGKSQLANDFSQHRVSSQLNNMVGKKYVGEIYVSLYSSNGFESRKSLADISPYDVSHVSYDPSMLRLANDNISVPIYEEARHKLPISVGLTLSYAFTDKLSVASGIVYTYLNSDFKRIMGDSEIHSRQLLHYLGVPVQLNYDLWKFKNLRTYINFGVEADWNVKGEMRDDEGRHMKINDAMQWSFESSGGLQYDILPKVGFYVQPGIRYYLNNGSSVKNVFKDKQFNFDIQFGIRVNVK